MSETHVAFEDLSPEARELLTSCVRGAGDTAPILADTTRAARSVLGVAALAALALGLTFVYAAKGFGRSVQGPLAAVAYAAGIGVALAAALAARRAQRAVARFPFDAGRYVFAHDFVDARAPTLRIVPLDLDAVTIADGAGGAAMVTLAFKTGARETFIVPSRRAAEKAAAALDADRDDELDDFAEVRSEAARAAARGTASGPPPKSAALPLLVGAVLGLLAFSLRNRLSDDAMFEHALAESTEPAFAAYLAGGTRHGDEVRTIHLPRAALAAAAKKGTVTALRGFRQRFPNSSADADTRAAIHALYQKALDDFAAKRSTSDPRVYPFMKKLLAWLERHETARVEVRFDRPSTQALTMVDTLLANLEAHKEGAIAKVAPHFDDASSTVREKTIVDGLRAAFAAVFPTDILSLEPSSPALAAAPAPSLAVAYRVAWGGDVYGDEKGGRKFVGIIMNFDIAMRVPDDPDALDFHIGVKPPDEFSVKYSSDDDGGKDRPSEGKIYDVMAERAFDMLSDKLAASFFKTND